MFRPYVLTFAVSVLALLASCKTVDTNVAEDATAETYFVRAQAASDTSDYDTALQIYQKFLDRGIDDADHHLISAEYEVAFLTFKKGNKDKAIELFRKILDKYKDVTAAAELPSWIKVLSAKKLQELESRPAVTPSP